ncbi:hypothetical protein D0Y65_041465, partial [Glycine soja]
FYFPSYTSCYSRSPARFEKRNGTPKFEVRSEKRNRLKNFIFEAPFFAFLQRLGLHFSVWVHRSLTHSLTHSFTLNFIRILNFVIHSLFNFARVMFSLSVLCSCSSRDFQIRSECFGFSLFAGFTLTELKEKGALDAEEQIQKAHVTKISYTRLFQSDKPITKGQAAIALATGDVLEMLLKYSICRP